MALPGWLYGDPARIIESAEIRERGCSVCVRSVSVGGQPMCLSGLKLPACKRDKKNGYKLSPADGG